MIHNLIKAMTLTGLCFSVLTQAQPITFTDATLKEKLLQNIEANPDQDTEITVDEALQVTSLNINGNYKSLGGLEHFVNLKSLYIDGPFIKELDVSPFTSLEKLNLSFVYVPYIDLDQNKSLKSYSHFRGRLKELKTPISLETLSYSSLHSMTDTLHSIDISNSPNLTHLSIFGMSLHAFDLSKNLSLEYFFTSFIPWHSVDFSKHTRIKNLVIMNSQLQELDISKLDVSFLDCRANPLLTKVCTNDLIDAYRLNYWSDHDSIIKACYDTIPPAPCHNDHITDHQACDDFMDANLDEPGINEYAIATDFPQWNDGPVLDKSAYKGLYWAASNSKGFEAQKSRQGDGILRYTLTQPAWVYEPIMLLFGSYADGNQEKKFSIDMSANKTFSFDLKNADTNADTNKMYCHVELEDINGKNLGYDQIALYSGDTLNREISFWNNRDFMHPGGKSSFLYDFSHAVCSELVPSVVYEGELDKIPVRNCVFDFSKVVMVKFFFYARQDFDQYVPKDLIDHKIEISNVRLGNAQLISNFHEAVINADDQYTFYQVYDTQGRFVAEGLSKDLKLKENTLYILKSNRGVSKKIIVPAP